MLHCAPNPEQPICLCLSLTLEQTYNGCWIDTVNDGCSQGPIRLCIAPCTKDFCDLSLPENRLSPIGYELNYGYCLQSAVLTISLYMCDVGYRQVRLGMRGSCRKGWLRGGLVRTRTFGSMEAENVSAAQPTTAGKERAR